MRPRTDDRDRAQVLLEAAVPQPVCHRGIRTLAVAISPRAPGSVETRAAASSKDAKSLPPEDIGLLTRPVEPAIWLSKVRARYAFVTALDETEQRVALCNPGDRYEVSQLVLALTGDG